MDYITGKRHLLVPSPTNQMRGCKSSQVRVHGRVVRNDNRFRAGGQDGTIAKAGLSWTPKCYSLSAKKLHKIKLCHNDFSSTQAPIALFNVFFFFSTFFFVFFFCLFAISYFWRQIIYITREPFAAAFIVSSFFLKHLRTKALRCN